MKRNLLFNSIIALIGLSIFIFVFSKASISSFTHDESYSYLHYPHAKFMDIVSFSDSYSNNHPMNTLLMKYSEKLFGNSELALRLPNLIMLLVYMFYSFMIFRRTNRLLAISMFTILCTNVLLIDLFGMARGYGMACGFMLISLYHFIQSFNDKRSRNLILFHAGAVFAVLSHFTLLTFYVSLLFIYLVMTIIEYKFTSNTKKTVIKSLRAHIIPFMLAVAILYEPVRKIVKFNSFDNGGKNGFFSDTVNDVVINSIHNTWLPKYAVIILQLIFCLIVLISFIIIAKRIIKSDREFVKIYKGLIISNLLIITISATIIFLHLAFKSDYPIGRFAIFLLPLFIVHLGFLSDYFTKTGHAKITISIAVVLATVSAISFVSKVDMYICAEWFYDSETKNMIQILRNYHDEQDNTNTNTSLGISWVLEPTINYYRVTKNIDWLLPVDRNGVNENQDYYYILKEDLPKLNSVNYIILQEFDRSGTYLIRNQGKVKINGL